MKNTLITTSFIAMTGMASAATLIDFSNATAAGAGADSNGNYWTTVGTDGNQGNAADLTATNLIDSTNTATSIDLNVDFSISDRNGWGGNGINGLTGLNPFDQSFAVIDGIYSSMTAGLVTLTFSELAASTVYNLSLIGGRASTGTDGLIAITTGTGLDGTLKNDGTQLDLSITSDASGVIAFTFVDSNNNFNTSATLNAMSITAVPEPSTTALLGLGGISLILRRRK